MDDNWMKVIGHATLRKWRDAPPVPMLSEAVGLTDGANVRVLVDK